MAMNLTNRIPYYIKHRSSAFKIWHGPKKLSSSTLFFRSTPQEMTENRLSNDESLNNFKESEGVVECIINGKSMKIASGKLARFADGCATVEYGDTTVMATAVSKSKTAASSFTPLTVSYNQKAAALGRIPLNFLRKELGQSDNEILTSRIIDRSIRPLFQEGFNWDTQLMCIPLAVDGTNFPDVLSINAASAALAVSDIPWNGPVGAVRLGLIGEEVVVNPTKQELLESSLNLIVTCRSRKLVVMLEGHASNILLPDFQKAIKVGIKECQVIIRAIDDLRQQYGKEKRPLELPEVDQELKSAIEMLSSEQLKQIFSDFKHDKLSRDEAVFSLQQKIVEKVKDNFSLIDINVVKEVFQKICKEIFRNLIFDTGVRCDGRALDELRNINCEVDLYKPLHGSAIFQRGQTQVMCTVALDSPNSALKMDRVSMITSGLKEKNFFVHYEFPPFATKDVGRIGPSGRREIGHGALAEKALKANVPKDFPFTIRLTSEVLESNGSSSMATVCGGSMALWDAGVPLENACAGVAMGLVTKYREDDPLEIEDYKIMTDLLGIEDYFGDMDFKIAGTKKAITAVQVDVKNAGLPSKIVMEILLQSRIAISEILKKMNSACSGPRIKKKENWPVVEKVTVPPHLRSKFLGPGGINIKRLEVDAGVEITEEGPGEFSIFAANKDAMEEAKRVIEEILDEVKEPTLDFGGVYTATIVEIKEHGCLVTLYPNMEPVLIHVSQLDQRKVSHPSALGITVGQKIQVKYFGRDPVSGMMRLSRKVLLATASEVVRTFAAKVEAEENLSSTETPTNFSEKKEDEHLR